MLRWFRRHACDLPWRRTRDPYCIWVSEIMLQQTQVATVIDYYERFIQALPTIADLAAADERDVLRLWEGLGYYRRARQLHQAAQRIVAEHGGQFPRDAEVIRSLPGIGRYTAGAIASIAWEAREPILEANTVRVFSRLLAFRGNPTRSAGQRLLWTFSEGLLPKQHVGLFNQSLMELGRRICTPRTPRCEQCPVRKLCPTNARGLQDEIPVAKPKTEYEDSLEAAVVVRRRGKVLLRQYGRNERWSGLWDFPRFAVTCDDGDHFQQELETKTAQATGITVEAGSRLTAIKHGVTRFRITLVCHEARYVRGRLCNGARWVPVLQLPDYPLSVTGRQIARLL
jgi:A/G-specific adenine glycosylase